MPSCKSRRARQGLGSQPFSRFAVPCAGEGCGAGYSTRSSPALALWQEHMPGGLHWSGLFRRGTRADDHARSDANVAALFFNFDERSERYNMPDTLKGQETAYLGKALCYSDMGAFSARSRSRVVRGTTPSAE